MNETDKLKRDQVEGVVVTLACVIIAVCALVYVSDTYPQSGPPDLDRVFCDGFEHPSEPCAEVIDPPASCPETPVGWRERLTSWERAWSPPADNPPSAVYPTNSGSVVPIGAAKGGYTVYAFVPNPLQVVNVYWEPVQAQQGYPRPRPAVGMYFAISPCKGDLRGSMAFGDPFLEAGCRKGGSNTTMNFHTLLFPPSNFQSCQLVAGEVYYMHILAANPDDGLTDGEHSCTDATNSAAGCDVQATHKPAF